MLKSTIVRSLFDDKESDKRVTTSRNEGIARIDRAAILLMLRMGSIRANDAGVASSAIPKKDGRAYVPPSVYDRST